METICGNHQCVEHAFLREYPIANSNFNQSILSQGLFMAERIHFTPEVELYLIAPGSRKYMLILKDTSKKIRLYVPLFFYHPTELSLDFITEIRDNDQVKMLLDCLHTFDINQESEVVTFIQYLFTLEMLHVIHDEEIRTGNNALDKLQENMTKLVKLLIMRYEYDTSMLHILSLHVINTFIIRYIDQPDKDLYRAVTGIVASSYYSPEYTKDDIKQLIDDVHMDRLVIKARLESM